MQPNDHQAPAAGALGPLEITEADLEDSRPRVRALLVARLEQMWEPIRVRLQQDAAGALPADPRFLELGVRICKELALHYRMYKPPPPTEAEEEQVGAGIDRAALINAQLEELTGSGRVEQPPDTVEP